MIVDAFKKTAWAAGNLVTQPKNNLTLVNLRTFYRLEWSTAGFQPGEIDDIDPATMLGYRVQIRPKLDNLVYIYGDGATSEPTKSLGGVYPNGEITHIYSQPGRFEARVMATFGADFSINGAPWVDLREEVTVQQDETRVTVREAKAVLVNR